MNMENGLRTFRPELSGYIYCNDQTEVEVKNWISSIQTGKATRAIMFAGPAGTGKTTLALALAKTLGVHDSDILERNGGTHGLKEHALEMIDGYLKIMPMRSPYRILIIDEAHKLTKPAQEAFLTPLEKLNSKAIVIACTSKPEELDHAFKTRFYRIELSKYSEDKIATILKGLPTQITPEVFDMAVKGCNGIPRAAIDIVERASSATPEMIQQITQLSKIVEALPENLMKYLCSPTPNYAAAYLLAGYIDENNCAKVFNKLLKHLDNIALTKMGQNPVMPPDEKEVLSICYASTLVNFWYPQFFRMMSEHPRALRAFIAQYLQI